MTEESPVGEDSESTAKITVQFCGSSCWKRSATAENAANRRQQGHETVEQLAETCGAEIIDENLVTEVILDGRSVTLQNMRRCLGACGNHPAARIKPAQSAGPTLYFRADSVQAVREAIDKFVSLSDQNE